MNVIQELSTATAGLPETVRTAMAAALDSGAHTIGAIRWQSELAVCPIVAAAMWAGVWEDGGVTNDAPEWGTPDRPSAPVEEFAAFFDMCAEDHGLDAAIEIVRAVCAASEWRDEVSL